MELLVVITIIGILIALLLPAVQAAREAARRMQNSNNLKQIGLAMIGYEQAWSAYPLLRDKGDAFALSWAFRLLPYMEQQAIFDSFYPRKKAFEEKNIAAMRTPVATYLNPSRRDASARCPFDDDNGVGPIGMEGQKLAACGDYAANRGWHDPEGALQPNNTCCEPFRKWCSGPFSTWTSDYPPKSQRVNSAMVTDGLSNTIAVGDKWLSDSMIGTVSSDSAFFCGDSPWTIQRGAERGFPSGFADNSAEKFGSPTGGTAAFVFLDGHVSSISYSISLSVFKNLCAVADGNVIEGVDY